MNKNLITSIFIMVTCSIIAFAENNDKTPKVTLQRQNNELVVFYVYYTCNTHKAVKYDNPGLCPVCAAKLDKMTINVSESNKDTIDMYKCPIHLDYISPKAGKCMKCGMELKKKERIMMCIQYF